LFDKMLLEYGKKFTDQWGGSDPVRLRDHWAAELAGFSGDELGKGLKGMAAKDWPPTLNEFKKLCRPPVDAMHAYYEAVNGVQARDRGERGVWSHRAIFWAATGLSFDLKNQTYSQIKVRWEMALAEQFDKTDWSPIPDPLLQLAAPGKGELSKEGAAKMLNEIGASAMLKPKNDEMRWAKNILERLKRKDKTLLPIQIKFAKEALEVKS
jgi:hypothetical protein